MLCKIFGRVTECQAVIEATALGRTRTAAMTGVGTKRLAPASADDMALAVDILAKAREQRLGHPVPERIKTPPRLK